MGWVPGGSIVASLGRLRPTYDSDESGLINDIPGNY